MSYPTLFNSRMHTRDDFQQALEMLSEKLSKRPISRQPIVLVSAGGFPALAYFGNRTSTEDIDYVVDATSATEDDIMHLSNAVGDVRSALQWTSSWMNSSLGIIAPSNRTRWIEEAVRQNVVLYESTYLKIYAARWEWSIATKMQRMGSYNPAPDLLAQGIRSSNALTSAHHAKRSSDLSDISTMLYQHLEKRNWLDRMKGLSRDEIRKWIPPNEGFPIFDKTFEDVKNHYQLKYGAAPFQ